MARERWLPWLLWAIFLMLVAVEAWAPHVVPTRQHPWHPAATAVAGFVLALLALAAMVGTFALRETLVMKDLRAGMLDPRSPAGLAQIRSMLLWQWTLCLLIGLFGDLIAYGAATPAAAWPYVAAAAVLLAIHAPRRELFVTSSA
jgi:hypothetical protein